MEIVHARVRGRAVGKGRMQISTSPAAYPTKVSKAPVPGARGSSVKLYTVKS